MLKRGETVLSRFFGRLCNVFFEVGDLVFFVASCLVILTSKKAVVTEGKSPLQAPKRLILRTSCYPAANGRRPKAGEQFWTFHCFLETGEVLYLHTGRKGRQALLHMLLQEQVEDAAEMMERPVPMALFNNPG